MIVTMHKKRRLVQLAVVAGAATTALVLASTAAADAQPIVSKITVSSGSFKAASGSTVTPLARSGVITAGSCKYRQEVDEVHVTGGEASVHGWWVKVSGSCPSKATVTVYLQAYGCFGVCDWVTVKDGKRDIKSGTSKRANARLACEDNHTVGWRGYVDVDLDGVHDPSGYTYGSISNLSCSP